MKLNRVSAAVAAAAVAGVAVLSGFCLAPQHAGSAARPVTAVSRSASAATPPHAKQPPRHAPHAAASAATPRADPAIGWLESAGGQAQVQFNNQVAALAADLWVENGSPTVANHLLFEAAARAVRAQAQKILTTPALLPAVSRAAYQRMLNDFIVVANLLQPGPGYGTTPQDYAAWNTAMNASNINVS